MSNEVDRPRDPMAEFQAQVFDKVRDAIGELAPEEMIATLVEKAINQAFFEPVAIKADRYGSGSHVKESRLALMIRERLEPIVRKRVEIEMESRKKDIEKIIDACLEEHKIVVKTVEAITEALVSELAQLRIDLTQRSY